MKPFPWIERFPLLKSARVRQVKRGKIMRRNLSGMEKKVRNFLWEFLARLFSKRGSPSSGPLIDLAGVKSILVVRSDRLGDVVLSTPVYASAKSSLPGVRLTALVDKANQGLLANNPNVDRILAWDSRKPWKILPSLRREKYDLAFTLNKTFSATASMLTLFSRARLRAGYRNPKNGWMHDIQAPTDLESGHEIQNNLELLKTVGMTATRKTPELFFNERETARINALLNAKRERPDRPLVLVKPGTRVPEWGWRLDKFQSVMEQLIKTGSAEVFLIRGPGEESLTGEFMRNMDSPPVPLPPLPVNELALLIQKSHLLFCNHTGIMHLASAVNTPVLAIFKHGDAARWGPYNTPNIILEERGGDSVSPETALQSINDLLKREKSGLREELEP